MLLMQGAERSERIDLSLACTLSAVAGALNASVLYVAGFFAANMTGNVTVLSDQLALGHWLTAGFYLSVVLLFVLGALVCTLALNAGLRQGVSSIYALVILAEAVLLIGLWALWKATPAPNYPPVLVLGLSFAMGLQNAAATRISEARVRTTHISGMATDIGIELAILFDRLRGKPLAQEDREALSRLRLHVATITCFLIGGIAGVLLYLNIGSALLLVCAGALMLLSGASLIRLSTRN